VTVAVCHRQTIGSATAERKGCKTSITPCSYLAFLEKRDRIDCN
jgi:hypothetical protein